MVDTSWLSYRREESLAEPGETSNVCHAIPVCGVTGLLKSHMESSLGSENQPKSQHGLTRQAIFGDEAYAWTCRFGRLEIRPLQKRDYSDVREIYKTVIDEYLQYQRQRSGEVYDPVGPHLDAAQLDFYVATHSSFVAIENRKLVGFLLAQLLSWVNDWDKALWLEYIAVHPAHRRRGVGLALISAAKEFARRHDIKGLFATLNVDNEESKSLLLRAKFDVKDWRIASQAL
ncbi:MAG TPA: GNAT family N-acetyltransferase [Candidatus Bathyarchaeia archaeon]|nr:GNAT family N-acetyltransferase [Candidatus Bathyarchaeia archaeon]